MVALPLATSSYRQEDGDLPPARMVNMYLEPTATEGQGYVRQSRPGLESPYTVGTGPVRQVFKRDLVSGGATFSVSGGTLYRNTASIGGVNGTGFVSIAGNEIGVMVTAGKELYFYDTSLSAVSFPDGADVAHVTVGGSRFWLVRKDTGKLYWTDPLDDDVAALAFLTAESLPDRLYQTLWIDGGLVAFGAESIEFFRQTGSSTLPLAPIENLVIEKGVKGTGCACNLMETFACVTNANQVIVQNENNIVSTPGLERRIEESATCSLFTFLLGGYEFLALRVDDETQVWNRRTGTWSEFQSYGQTNWIPQCYSGGYFGSAIDGRIIQWTDDHEDFGAQLTRILGGGFPVNGGGQVVGNLRLRANTGHTPYLTGTYADPVVEMRLSDDAGQTWSDWEAADLGTQGAYRDQAEWRALGMASYPGMMFEFRVTDPVPVRISDAFVNEPLGGR